jgi:hypothetical protein
MGLKTLEEIKNIIRERLDEIAVSNEPEENLPYLADEQVPIYYSDTIKEWLELPNEYMDRWKDYGYDANKNDGGILSLMNIDLNFYYLEMFDIAWEEIQKEEEK